MIPLKIEVSEFLRKSIVLSLSLLILDSSTAFSTQSPPSPSLQKHGIAIYGEPKYKKGFSHFDYVNPNAPKRGSLKIGAIGTFDSLNPYSFKGIPAAGTGVLGNNYVFDSLMTLSGDEPETLYGLVAETVEMPKNRSWMIFNLNKKARWPDGKPITTADVQFTWETLRDHGRPFMQAHYKKVSKVELLDSHRIKFYLRAKKEDDGTLTYERDLPLLIGRMVVLPQHILQKKDFHKLKQEDVVGSGPYKIKDVKMGHSITYERRQDYWAKDLAPQKGRYNFNTIHYHYYRNVDVMFEAFKVGDFDLLIEADPRRWNTSYTFKAVKEGRIKKLELRHKRPVGLRGFVMNTRRPFFQDRTIRKALLLAFDFKWVNETLFYNTFNRSKSYFENTKLASKGLPSKEELALLEPFRDQIPEDVFTQPYKPPSFNTSQEKRQSLTQAKNLLKKAGCVLKRGKLIHPLTQKPFKFEMLITRTEEEKLGLALQRDLKQLGIEMTLKTVDEPQYWARTTSFDFDMVIFLWSGSFSPSGGVLLNRWGTPSASRKGSLNYMGCKDPVIDSLCGQVNKAQTWEELATATKALDRVLLWGHYVIPLFHDTKNRVAVWDKFRYPKFDPLVGISTTPLWSKEAERPSSYPQMPEIEALSMLMAKACGIDTVPFLLIQLKDGHLAYLTRRIDRNANGDKFAMEDACQFTERLTEHKYRGSYEQIAKGIITFSKNPLFDVVRFYEQVIVSFLIGNNDMHLKNFSLISYDGKSYSLAPAYDMISAQLLVPDDPEELALNLNGKKRKLEENGL